MEVDVVSLVSEFPNDNPALHRGVRWICLDVTGGCSAEQPEPGAVIEAAAVEAPIIEGVTELAAEAPVEAPVVEEVTALAAEAEAEAADADGDANAAADVAEDVAIADGADDDGAIIVEEMEPLGEIEPETMVPPLAMVATETLPPPTDAGETPTDALPPPPDDPFTVLVCRLADIAIGAGSPEVASILPALLMDGSLAHDVSAETAEALRDAGIVVDGAVTESFAVQTAAWRAILRGTSDDFDACGGAMLDEWAADLLACLFGARSRGAALRKDLRARGVAAFGLVEAA